MKQSLDSLAFSNSFAKLPDAFYSRVTPTPFAKPPRLLHFNAEAAALLDLDPAVVDPSELAAIFSGQRALPGSEPLAMLYAGHQFGHYVPQLGDGRAILLGEVTNRRNAQWEIQLKGSGLTPYSRDGDGRAVLRSTIREYLCSEAMHGLGIPTTRALCIVGSDEEVYRENIETAAMLTRLAPSHVRFGSFEVFFYRDQPDQLRQLADYVIGHHYPELADHPDRYHAWFAEIVARTARLLARWQAVGFAHGVMNTDNMSILGLTLDYGPFGFMEAYDPGYVCNHSDHQGRYAFDQQPQIGLWNLTCLAQALSPLLGVDAAKDALAQYQTHFTQQYYPLMVQKLGFDDASDEHLSLTGELLDMMQRSQADYSIVFRALCQARQDDEPAPAALRDRFLQRERFDRWYRDYRQALRASGRPDAERQAAMREVNPKYILRNYLAQQAIDAAGNGDYGEIDRLLQILRDPFAEQPEFGHYADPPPDWAARISVSCSS
jgi:uncharacterized protein YdiU (UPF0061 family)